MATTKATAKPAAKPTAPRAEAPKPDVKKNPKDITLSDSTIVRVRSNQYGVLGYRNSRTGDDYTWSEINEVQDLTVADIRDMRSNGQKFFSEPWIWIEEIDDPQCKDLTTEEIYEVLHLSRYLEQAARPRYMSEIVDWSVDKIRERVPKMSESTKTNVIVALNTEIAAGNLDSMQKVRAWEEALKCTLTDLG